MDGILIIEDDFMLSKELKDFMQLEFNNVIVDTTSTYTRAIELCKLHTYKIIFIDIMMPFSKDEKSSDANLDSYLNTGIVLKNKIHEILESRGIRNNCKIGFFSAKVDVGPGDLGNLDFHITKPILLTELINFIRDNI